MTLVMAQTLEQSLDCLQQLASQKHQPFWGVTMQLLFLKDWRSFRAGAEAEVDNAVAELLTRRGFAISAPKPKPKQRKRKASDGTNSAQRSRKRSASN